VRERGPWPLNASVLRIDAVDAGGGISADSFKTSAQKAEIPEEGGGRRKKGRKRSGAYEGDGVFGQNPRGKDNGTFSWKNSVPRTG